LELDKENNKDRQTIDKEEQNLVDNRQSRRVAAPILPPDGDNSDTEEMEEEEEDLGPTLPLGNVTNEEDMLPTLAIGSNLEENKSAPGIPATACKKPTNDDEESSTKATMEELDKNDTKQEDSGTERIDELDLLPTLPVSEMAASKRKYDADANVKRAMEESNTQAEKRRKAESAQTSSSRKDSLLGHQRVLQPLPEFLDGVVVFFHGKGFDAEFRRLLQRYVVAYKGRISPYLYDDVTHVVTTDDWGKDFDRALLEHPNLTVVHPEWLLDSHLRQKKVSTGEYCVV